MLLAVAALLVLLWLVGLIAHVVGAAIHLLLILAVVVAVLHLLRGRTSRV